MTPPLDLAAIEARCNAAKNSADPIKHYGLWRTITGALADIPALIARVRELESDRDALKAENARISGLLENIMNSEPDKMIAEAVAAEREAIATIAYDLCEHYARHDPGFEAYTAMQEFADAIRARGEKENG